MQIPTVVAILAVLATSEAVIVQHNAGSATCGLRRVSVVVHWDRVGLSALQKPSIPRISYPPKPADWPADAATRGIFADPGRTVVAPVLLLAGPRDTQVEVNWAGLQYYSAGAWKPCS